MTARSRSPGAVGIHRCKRLLSLPQSAAAAGKAPPELMTEAAQWLTQQGGDAAPAIGLLRGRGALTPR